MLRTVGWIAVFGALATLTTSAASQSKWMTGAEMRAKLVGKTRTYSGRTKGTTIWHSNGTVNVKDSKHGTLKGRWWIKGNSWCRTYSKWPKKTKCLKIRDLGDGRYRTNTGVTSSE